MYNQLLFPHLKLLHFCLHKNLDCKLATKCTPTLRKATEYLEGGQDGDLKLPEGFPERSSFSHVQTHGSQSPLEDGAHPVDASRSPHATYRVLCILQPDVRTCGKQTEEVQKYRQHKERGSSSCNVTLFLKELSLKSSFAIFICLVCCTFSFSLYCTF